MPVTSQEICYKMFALVSPVMLKQDAELKHLYDILSSQSKTHVFTYDEDSFNLTILSHIHIFDHLTSMKHVLYRLRKHNREVCKHLIEIVDCIYEEAANQRLAIQHALPVSRYKSRFQRNNRIVSLFASNYYLELLVFELLEGLSYSICGRSFVSAMSIWWRKIHQKTRSLALISQDDNKENTGLSGIHMHAELFYLRNDTGIELSTVVGEFEGYNFTYTHFILFQLYHMIYSSHGGEIPYTSLNDLYQQLHLRRLPECTFKTFYDGIKHKYL